MHIDFPYFKKKLQFDVQWRGSDVAVVCCIIWSPASCAELPGSKEFLSGMSLLIKTELGEWKLRGAWPRYVEIVFNSAYIG